MIFLIARSIFLVVHSVSDEDEEGGISGWVAMLIGFVFVVFASFISTLVGLALSRTREYLADAAAVEMTGNPAAMASALEKVAAVTRWENPVTLPRTPPLPGSMKIAS